MLAAQVFVNPDGTAVIEPGILASTSRSAEGRAFLTGARREATGPVVGSSGVLIDADGAAKGETTAAINRLSG